MGPGGSCCCAWNNGVSHRQGRTKADEKSTHTSTLVGTAPIISGQKRTLSLLGSATDGKTQVTNE
eukprot:scaffold2192_cov170-Amphora_coffeaeformis.AAC.14